MDFRLVRAVIAVADGLSISRALGRLHSAPPPRAADPAARVALGLLQ